MSLAFNYFEPFVASIGNDQLDLSSDTLMVALFTGEPSTDDVSYDGTSKTLISTSNAAEATGGGSTGYTYGGTQLTGNDYTQSSGTATLSASGTPSWTAGSSGITFRYIVLYDGTAGVSTARPLIGWWDWGSSLTLGNGQVFTLSLPDGVFTLAQA